MLVNAKQSGYRKTFDMKLDSLDEKTKRGYGITLRNFEKFYYSFSPVIADYERENPIFKEAVKVTITPLINSLAILNYVDIDSEEEVLGYGIGLILMNIGMYFVVPVVGIMKIRELYKKR